MTRRSRLGLRAAATIAAMLALCAVTLAACGTTSGGATAAKGKVNVAYAGSLVNLMEHKLGPAFDKATGYTFQGRGAGSTALANQIKSKLITPDIFISASAASYKPLEGDANGKIVRWYVTFATTSMVIGYSPQSRFASQLDAAASGKTPWYQVLQTPGLRLGRTDPKLDPKGVNTLFTLQLAEQYYHQPGLTQALTGGAENPTQIFPEEELVARLTAGQLDAGFFYLNEVKDAGLPYITLPTQINLGDPTMANAYAQASYTSVSGTDQHGAPITFSVTIPTTVTNEVGAEAFITYLLGSSGRTALTGDGFTATPLAISGDASQVPVAIDAVISK